MTQIFKILSDATESRVAGAAVVKTLHLGMLGCYKQTSRDAIKNALLADAFGEAANVNYYTGELVCADIEFSTTNYNGRYINNPTISNIYKLQTKN